MAGMDTDMDEPSNPVMKRLEEGRQLSWRCVKHNTWVKLANKLDVNSPVSNNDWRALAERLGFTTEDILVLETSKDRSTIALFANYMPTKNASVNSVAKALKQMNRDDALQILLEAVPDIEAGLDARSQKSTLEAVEGDDTCMTNITQGGCCCVRSPSRSGGCTGCFTCSHPHPHQQFGMASGGCCCFHVSNLPYRAPSVTCSSQGHPSVTHPHTGCAGTMSPLPSHSYNIPESNGTRCQGGRDRGSRDLYNSPIHHSGSKVPLQSQHSHPHHPGPLQRSVDMPPSSPYHRSVSDSMHVYTDMDSQQQRGLTSFSPSKNEDMEIDGGPAEEPTALHIAMARGEQLLSGIMDIGDNTPSTSLEELSSSDSSSRHSSMPLNVVRQVSEECNMTQPFTAVPGSPRGRPAAYNRVDSSDSAAWGADGAVGTERSEVNAFGNSKTGKESQSSLKHLETLSQLPSRFKPDNNYTTMVAKQQLEEINHNQRGGRPQIKRERDSTRSCPSSESSRSGGSSLSRSRAVGADTFPLRVKPQTGGATVEQVRSRQPGALTKTTSVPIDMKVEEFKKAFRHIKVFVTYTNDSKQHCRQVLSLCNCLDKNGFSCCVDVNPPHNSSSDQAQESRNWCMSKFKEADFVLVCLSPLYLQEIKKVDEGLRGAKSSSSSSSNGRSSKDLLHTSYIYQLMRQEFQTTKRCSRFVLLYMEGSSCDTTPSWLTNHLCYDWPRQYKDLLWMLTKPEDRIKQRSRSSQQKNHGAVKVNGLHGSPLLSSPLH